jgi:hypothetical protein
MTYAALHASESSMPVPFRYENGQAHRVVFLPDGTLLDSPRRELEGEGLSDLKLIEFIRSAIDRGPHSSQGRQALREELEAVLSRVAPDKDHLSLEPRAWESARNELYDLALRATSAREARALKPN